MGIAKDVRPENGFSVAVQMVSLGSAFALLCIFLLMESVPWHVKGVLLLLLVVVFWLPRSLAMLAQSCFERGSVLFFYPPVRAVSGDKPLIALTIDDGPAWEFDNGPASECTTERIRKVLAKYGARATWFIIGSHVRDDRETLLKTLVDDGHELANHGMHDRPAWKLDMATYEDDVECTQKIIEQFGGQRRWFRPGQALFTPSQFRWLRKNGYRLAIGSVYPHDALDLPPWQNPYPSLLARVLLAKATAGDVLIIHDRPWTPAVLEVVLPILTETFTICTLSELADACEGVGGDRKSVV